MVLESESLESENSQSEVLEGDIERIKEIFDKGRRERGEDLADLTQLTRKIGGQRVSRALSEIVNKLTEKTGEGTGSSE